MKEHKKRRGKSIQYSGLQMNKGTRKLQEMVRRSDLRDDEVDGHFCHRGNVEEGTSSKILELLDSAAAGKVKSELWNDVMEKEYPRRNYL